MPIDKRIGVGLVGLGALFLLMFTGALIEGEFYQDVDNGARAFLNALGIMGLLLLLIGIVCNENSIFRSFKNKDKMIRTAMIASITLLFTGGTRLFLLFGPNMGFQSPSFSDGTITVLWSYLFTLGIMLLLGITIIPSPRGMRMARDSFGLKEFNPKA
jgi:hypothetical protein